MSSPVTNTDRPLVCVIDDWDGLATRSTSVTQLREIAEVDVVGHASEDELVERIHEADVVIPIRERRAFTSSLLDRLPNLRHIAQTGGGAAHIDKEAAAARDIQISLTPGASAAAVAELVIGLILAAERGIVAGAAALSDGRWERPLGRELESLRLGVVGAGATGMAVARRAAALGLDVLVASRRPAAVADAGFEVDTLDQLCQRCDIISVHVELSPSTRGLLQRPHLRAIGPSGGLVNAARAAIVDQNDLREALDSGELGWAAVDVFEQEPPNDDPLVTHERVIATPHLGWRTSETLGRYLDGAVQNAIAYLRERPRSDG